MNNQKGSGVLTLILVIAIALVVFFIVKGQKSNVEAPVVETEPTPEEVSEEPVVPEVLEGDMPEEELAPDTDDMDSQNGGDVVADGATGSASDMADDAGVGEELPPTPDAPEAPAQ